MTKHRADRQDAWETADEQIVRLFAALSREEKQQFLTFFENALKRDHGLLQIIVSMGKKLPELCVERVLLTGRCAGGEHFFIRRAGEVGGRCAEGGGDDLELVGAGLGFAGLPVLADGRRAADAAGDGRLGHARLADQRFESAINKQNRHLAFV